MKRLVITLILLTPLFFSYPQQDLSDIEFILGKWKATASDSSFSSVLEYKYSPNKRLVLAINHLYGKSGDLLAVYEGAYLFEVGHLVFFIAGPGGETHRGRAELRGNTVTHWAKIFPGKGVKSYKSEMQLVNKTLVYYANYSNEEVYPEKVDYSNPLVYSKVK